MKTSVMKLLALALAVLMCLSLFPVSVFADAPTETMQEEEIIIGEEPEEESPVVEEESPVVEEVSPVVEEVSAEEEGSVLESVIEEEIVSDTAMNTVVHSGTCGNNLTWTLDEEGTLTITGRGQMDDFGYVTKDYTTVTVGIREWKDYQEQIKKIVIQEGVTSIGDVAFHDCKNLTEIEIPNSVTSIGDAAFSSCGSVEEITIPDSVSSIGRTAFARCSRLIEFRIPDSVESIGDLALYYCPQLTSVTIPARVNSMGEGPFASCENLLRIEVSPENQYYCNDEAGVLYSKDKSVLIQAPSKLNGSYSIPDGVTNIGGYSFCRCSNLTGIEIPDSVTSIETHAFEYSGLLSVTIPNGVTAIDRRAFYWCSYLTSAVIPDSVISVGEYAFHQCGRLRSLTISPSISSVGANAFNLPKLSDIYFCGTEEEWNAFKALLKDNYGKPVQLNATVHFVFSITVERGIANGKVTADKTSAEKNEKVTLTVTPAEGYVLRNLFVTSATGRSLTLINNRFTMPDSNVTITAIFKATSYTVTWLNDNDSLIAYTTEEYGVLPTHADATKEATAEYTYTFAGWTPEIKPVTGPATYKASFTSTKNKYAVTWLNDDGSVIDTVTEEYGVLPTHADAEKAATAECTYTFAGWIPEIQLVTGPATYKASYTSTKNRYVVTWLNDDGSVIDTVTEDYGVFPTHADAEKAATAEYTYTFAGWTPEVKLVTGTATYRATFTSSRNKYTVTFDTDGGTPVPAAQLVEYGSHASQPDQIPGKIGSSFDGWYLGEELFQFRNTVITENITLKAKWKVNEYTIIWMNDDNTMIDTTNVRYGEIPTHEDPAKMADAKYTYAFSGWDPKPQAATGTAIYKASYSKTVNSYIITWQMEDGSVIDTTTVEYGALPTHADAAKAATAVYTYTFAGWTPEVTVVTEDAVYRATFTSSRNKYTVTFDTDGGIPVPAAQRVEYGSEVERPVDPTRDASKFLGWFEEDSETPFDLAAPITGDMTLKARWMSVAEVVGSSLATKGKIGLNFYVTIPAELYDGMTARFSYGNTVVPAEPVHYKDDIYSFSISLQAPDDQKLISLKLYDADGDVIPMFRDGVECEEDAFTDSIFNYLVRSEAKQDRFTPLAAAMRNYFEYARQYFGRDTDIPAVVDPITVDRSLVAPYEAVIPNMPAGITFNGFTLVMDSDTALRLFFTVGSGSKIGDFRFAIDGNAVTPILRSGSMYYVEISDIWGMYLNKPHTVSVNGIQITNVSALSSVYRTLGNSSSTEALKQAVMALYYYNQAAKDYFG